MDHRKRDFAVTRARARARARDPYLFVRKISSHYTDAHLDFCSVTNVI